MYSAVAAPVCPLGKLDVGGEASSRFTSGRCRLMVSGDEQEHQRLPRHRHDQEDRRSRHRFIARRSETATTIIAPMIAPVLPSPERR